MTKQTTIVVIGSLRANCFINNDYNSQSSGAYFHILVSRCDTDFNEVLPAFVIFRENKA